MNAIVNLFSGPGLPIFEVLQDINLPDSFRGILKAAVPEAMVGKSLLSGAGSKDFVPGFGLGEFVLETSHRSGNLFTEVKSG